MKYNNRKDKGSIHARLRAIEALLIPCTCESYLVQLIASRHEKNYNSLGLNTYNINSSSVIRPSSNLAREIGSVQA